MKLITIPKGLLILDLLIIALWGIREGRPFLVPLSIAILLAFMMAPCARALKKMGLPEMAAIIASIFALLLPIMGLGFMVVNEAQALIRDYPSIIRSMDHFFSDLAASSFSQKMHLSALLNPSLLVDKLASQISQGLQFMLTGLATLLNAGSQATLVLLFAVLMLASRQQLRISFERILLRYDSIKAPRLLEEASGLIELFLLRRLLIVFIVGIADAGILMAFKMNYALLMGVFLGAMTFIPAIGFILGLIPPLIVALATGRSLLSMAFMTGALLIVSFIEGNVLTPKLVGSRLNINILATFIGLFAGGLMWGIWGMLLSIPILAILRIVLSASSGLEAWGNLIAETPNSLERPERAPSRERDRKKAS